MALALITSTLSRTPATERPTVEQYLYGNQRTQLNRLNGAVVTSATSITFDYDADGIRPGAVLELDDELYYVWSVSGQTATVEPAYLGTTPTSHSDNSLIRVEPRFLRTQMTAEISKEIRSWPTNVYARYTGDLSITATQDAIDLEGMSGITGVQLLRCQIAPPSAEWDQHKQVEARIERRQNSTDFPSGYALVVPQTAGRATTLRVTVRAPFVAGAITTSTDLGSLGLTHDLVDIIPWGVAARMVATRDIARTDANAQGRSRPAEEVRPGDAISVGQQLMRERDRLLAEAANRLLAEDGMGWS